MMIMMMMIMMMKLFMCNILTHESINYSLERLRALHLCECW